MRLPHPTTSRARTRLRTRTRARHPRAWLRRRSTITFWALTGLLATATGATTLAVTSRAQDALSSWGTTRDVPVATREVEPGRTFGADDVAWEARPVAVLPDGVVGAGTALDGRVAIAAIHRGEPVTADRVAPEGLHGVAALLPPGCEAITLAPSTHHLAVQLGDRVDVWRAADRAAVGATPAAALIARTATVVDATDDGSVTIGVTEREAPEVAAAVGDGSVVLAVVRP